MNKLLVVVSFFLSIFTTSCTSNGSGDNCISYVQAKIENVSIPEIGIKNQNIPVNIYFQCINGCGEFRSIEETNNGKVKVLKVIAKYEGCLCTQVLKTINHTYNFIATDTGTYTVNFLQPDSTVISHSIVIK